MLAKKLPSMLSMVTVLSCSAGDGTSFTPAPMAAAPTSTATSVPTGAPPAVPTASAPPSATALPATPTATAPPANTVPPTVNPNTPPPYDPNVGFDWPETVPSAGPCLPGTYKGQYSCQLNPGGIFPPGTVSGDVTFVLQQSSSGEFLEIHDGTLGGQTDGLAPIVFSATLGGKLDCTTNAFHADVTTGTYGVPPFSGTFGGTLDAALDRTTQTLSGTWTLEATGTNLPCTGPWSVVRQP